MAQLKRMLGAAALALVAACGAPATASPGDTPASQSAQPEGLPADAVKLSSTDGKEYWGVPREDGRILLYETMADGQMAATAGPLKDLETIYTWVDFAPLKEKME
ncbi:hypothetical protein K1X12_00350 [Hyphomonas sp. WL0036]|uniref:hypothetical protein n=1 Tax=Hyphomonas sediminis TaxID=2866160 RepID=UPI001C80D451|nr:hypothetical protein [Hyphomonas sediminis]MBY9065325.1 hypothetical protein [Hyphomonas sediminis]